jgi:hypothetical protein
MVFYLRVIAIDDVTESGIDAVSYAGKGEKRIREDKEQTEERYRIDDGV